MTWLIRIKASKNILDIIEKYFKTDELGLIEIESCFYLKSNLITSDDSDRDVSRKGYEIIEYINSALNIYSRIQCDIEPDGFYKIDKNQRLIYRFHEICPPTSFPINFVRSDLKAPPIQWYLVWSKDERVRYVFKLIEKRLNNDWYTLNIIYETIRDDPIYLNYTSESKSGGIAKIISWIGSDKNDSLFRTINWHRHSDYGMSKGKENCKPQKDISNTQANIIIRELISYWMEDKVMSRTPAKEQH